VFLRSFLSGLVKTYYQILLSYPWLIRQCLSPDKAPRIFICTKSITFFLLIFLEDIGERDAWFSSRVQPNGCQLLLASFDKRSGCFLFSENSGGFLFSENSGCENSGCFLFSFGDVSRLSFWSLPFPSRFEFEVFLHTVHAAHAFACGVVVAVGTRAKARQCNNGASVCF